jgi:hypothetical protein
MKKRGHRRRWVAPDRYLQYLYDNALVTIELYYQLYTNQAQADFEAFWYKTGYIWVN